MTDSNGHPPRKSFAGRRLALLGSVAVLGSAVIFSGALNHGQFASSALAAPVAQTQGPNGFADLVGKVKPAVISVRMQLDEALEANTLSRDGEDQDLPGAFNGTPFQRFFQQRGSDDNGPQIQRHQVITGLGSGFFISADGYAVTNNHVVDHARTVQVTTDDGKSYTAKVIGTDPKTDLALIKVEGGGDFTYVNFEVQRPRIRDWVVAVGNPYGLRGTVNAAIIPAEG